MAALFANLARMNRRVIALIVIPFLLFAFGTVGYMLIEGWNAIDAFYMTAITLTTVGFGEVQTLTTNGRIFTVALLVAGVAFIAYGLEYLLTANLGDTWRERRMKQTIDSLENHVIVCGYGRVGQSAVASLQNSKRLVIVLEKDAEKAEELQAQNMTYLIGDATKDEALQQAGIDRAWGMLVCTGDDSRNLFIVLSARALNANLYIVTRSVDAENDRKMRRAGANRVVSPYRIGGHWRSIRSRRRLTMRWMQ